MVDLNTLAKEYGYDYAEDTDIKKDGYEIYALGLNEPCFIGLPSFLLVKGAEVKMIGGEEGFELHHWLCENYYNDEDEEDEDEDEEEEEEEEEEEVISDGESCYWHKEKSDKVWFLENGTDNIVFSFDRIHKFYLYRDYPYKLTREQKEIFDKENPFWADFFKCRTEEWEKTHKE